MATKSASTQAAPWRPWYERQVAELQAALNRVPYGQPIRLAKATSNLFRPRVGAVGSGLDVQAFDGVLEVDVVAGTAEVLGMTTYEHLVDATLPFGFMPMCVPQLRTITLGGAVTGLGIESASFRNGLPHESVIDMDILTGDGRVLTVSGASDDPNRDLFFAFPNSYGSLGYALRLRIELEPVKPYVSLRHVPFPSADAMTSAMEHMIASGGYEGERIDFLDGVVFAPDEQYLTIGTMVDQVPDGMRVSDYTGMEIYYRSIQTKKRDVLTIHDYLWRWDTDWFWCSRAFGAQKRGIRRIWPKSKLRSDVYWKIVALDRRWQLTDRLAQVRNRPRRESVVQDVEVPIQRLSQFLDFFHQEVGIEPIWVCPLRQRDPDRRWPLYEFDPQQTYVNVGFWSTVELRPGEDPDAGRINRRIEDVVTELDGRKSLYSTAFYGQDEFWSIYGGNEYQRMKKSYDPDGRLRGLYEKVVEQQ